MSGFVAPSPSGNEVNEGFSGDEGGGSSAGADEPS
jgi:hypothetical protein